MKAYPDKCHFICGTIDKVNLTGKSQEIFNSPHKKRLGIRLDSSLTISPQINDIFKIAVLKLKALPRMTPYLDFNEK